MEALPCYKSVGWLAATTLRLFLDLLELSDSSLWVGSTETFLGLPRVTREDAMAMPVSRDSEHALQSP